MINTVIYWLAAALILLFFELSSPGHFFFLSFSCGALAGALANWLGYTFFVQSCIALISTSISFFILFFWVKKQAHRFTKKEYQSNIYSLVGKEGFIIKEPMPEDFGQVKIGGEIWSCRVVHDEVFKIGTEVRITRVTGSHVVVEKINER